MPKSIFHLLKFEDYGPYAIGATRDGDTFVLQPWIGAIKEDMYKVSLYVGKGPVAESAWTVETVNKEFLADIKPVACRRHHAFIYGEGWVIAMDIIHAQLIQNRDLYFCHLKPPFLDLVK